MIKFMLDTDISIYRIKRKQNEVIAYDTAAAYQFGQFKQELKNQPIGPYDLMIAAHARSLGLTL